MLAADTLGSYGGLARFKGEDDVFGWGFFCHLKCSFFLWVALMIVRAIFFSHTKPTSFLSDLRRIRPVGDFTLLGAGGEYSDYQYIMQQLDRATTHDYCVDDGSTLDPSNVHSLLTRMMYQRRNKGDPLWNSLIVAGCKPGKGPFLGYVDSIATAYEGDFIATGYGGHLAIPIMRNEWKADMTEEEAFGLLRKCMEVLYYRDCRTLNRITFATVTEDGANVREPVHLKTEWEYALFVKPKAGGDTDGSW